MSKEANIAANERWGDEVANQGRLEVLDEIMAEHCVDHDPAPDQGPGREGFKQFFASMRQAFPDFKATPEQVVADDEFVVMRYWIEGTHEGDFDGMAPTRKRFRVNATQIARFEDGIVVERWGNTDQLGMLDQLGLVKIG